MLYFFWAVAANVNSDSSDAAFEIVLIFSATFAASSSNAVALLEAAFANRFVSFALFYAASIARSASFLIIVVYLILNAPYYIYIYM